MSSWGAQTNPLASLKLTMQKLTFMYESYVNNFKVNLMLVWGFKFMQPWFLYFYSSWYTRYKLSSWQHSGTVLDLAVVDPGCPVFFFAFLHKVLWLLKTSIFLCMHKSSFFITAQALESSISCLYVVILLSNYFYFRKMLCLCQSNVQNSSLKVSKFELSMYYTA